MMSGLEKILAKLEEGSARGPSADRNRTTAGRRATYRGIVEEVDGSGDRMVI